MKPDGTSPVAWARAGAAALESALFQSQRGRVVVARLVTPGDADLIADLLGGLSARSLYLRYCLPMTRMGPDAAQREAARLGEIDPARRLAAIALARVQGVEQAVAVAELARDGNCPSVAEIAVVVADAYQREGIGSALCAYLVAAGRRHGITAVQALALEENAAVRRMVARSGAAYTAETRRGMTTIQIDIQRRGPSSSSLI